MTDDSIAQKSGIPATRTGYRTWDSIDHVVISHGALGVVHKTKVISPKSTKTAASTVEIEFNNPPILAVVYGQKGLCIENTEVEQTLVLCFFKTG
jgi:hypothetical protein